MRIYSKKDAEIVGIVSEIIEQNFLKFGVWVAKQNVIKELNFSSYWSNIMYMKQKLSFLLPEMPQRTSYGSS